MKDSNPRTFRLYREAASSLIPFEFLKGIRRRLTRELRRMLIPPEHMAYCLKVLYQGYDLLSTKNPQIVLSYL